MSRKPYRILIVEDCPEDREFYRRRIAQGHENDYLFWETGSGEEGLRLCREIAPDCVLLDYQLPDLDGLEFLDRFAAAAGTTIVPIIMLTAHGSEAVAVQAMKKGIHDYLIKSITNNELRQVVQAAIDKGILRRQLDEQRCELERLSEERLHLIAQLQQQTAALSDANQRKDDFLAMLAHELRNPLTPLRNMLHIMQMPGVQDSAVAEARTVMERQVSHLARLVDDLLDVSRITRGRIELRKEAVDVAALARRVVETNRPYLEARRHAVTVELPSVPVFVEADSVRLEQILSNLLTNAAKYTELGGRIGLTVALQSGQVVVHVRDNGMGIPADLLPCVFDLFTQGSRSLDRSQGGLGIGLTLVKRLVELHGGTVQAFSAGPNRGSEFIVRLPARAQPPRAAEPLAPKDGQAAPQSRRILVVDDNVDAADSLTTLLSLQGHRVYTAYDSLAALRTAAEECPEVVLLDIGLPGMDGYEVARRLRQEPGLEKVVLVALTGYGQQEDRRRAREVGFDKHLVKPADIGALHEILHPPAVPTNGEAERTE